MFNQNKPFGGFGGSTFTGNTTPFGGTGFGSGGFGGQTPAPTGLFGSTNTSTASGGLFGGAGTTSFGQNQQSTGFGTTNFGGAAGSSLFGNTGQQQPQQQSASLFSTPTTSSVFGAKTPGTTTNTGFGTTGQSGNVFGAANTGGSTLFGQNNPTSLFGASAAAFGGQQQNVSGTTIKFNPLNGQDTMLKGGVSTTITTRHQCITAMKEYENKSLEELRFEDYAANRKGPQAGGTTPLLSSTQTAPTSFSFNANKPSTGFGGFGGNTAAGSSTLFGQQQQTQQQQQQQQGTSLFGANTSKPLFGSTTATTTTASTGFTGFGNTGSNLFGQNQQQNKGLFGTTATTQSGGLFGGNTATSTGGFGTTGFGFGQTSQAQTGGLFGQKPAGFGAVSSSGGTIGFGQPNTAGGTLFAKPATTNTAFGFGQTSTAGFGAPQNTGGLFGTKPTGFGTATNTLGSTGFGSNLGAGIGTGGTSLFGANQNKPGLNLGFGTGTGIGASTTAGIGIGAATTLSTTTEAAVAAQQAQIQQHMMYLQQCPYGDNPLFRNVEVGAKREEALKPTNPVAQKAILSSSSSQYKVSSRPMAKIKPKPIQSMMSSKSQLFDGFEEEDSFGNTTFVPRKSIKKLVIKKREGSTPPGGTPAAYPSDARRDASLVGEDLAPVSPGLNHSGGEAEGAEEVSDVIVGSRDVMAPVDNAVPSPIPNMDDSLIMPKFRSKRGPPRESSLAQEDSGAAEPDDELDDQGTPAAPHPAGLVLRRSDYYTLPSLEELASTVGPDGSCVVVDFVVGRSNYGNVFFPGRTDVAGLNLDEIVHFRHKEVTVYPNEEGKPEEGEGLNKLAQVTLDRVWPNDKTDHTPIKSPSRLKLMGFEDRLMRATAKMGAKFVDYRPDNGSWVFEVKHFSKYGLQNDSDEEEDAPHDPKRPRVPGADQLQQLAVQRAKIAQAEAEAKMMGSTLGQVTAEDGATSQPVRTLGGMTSPEAETLQSRRTMLRLGLAEEDSDMADIMEEKFPSDDEEPVSSSMPGSQRLASQLGVSAHSVQLMKASFFGEEEEEGEERRVPSSRLPTSSRLSRSMGLGGGSPSGSPSQFSVILKSDRPTEPVTQSPVAASPISSPRKHSFLFARTKPPAQQVTWAGEGVSRSAGPQVPEHPLIPSGLVGMDQPRKLVGSRVQRKVAALEDSLMYNRQRMAMDAALFRGRAFRVGWGPGWTLAHTGNPIIDRSKSMEEDDEKISMYGGVLHPVQRRLDSSPYQMVMEQVLPGTLAEDLSVKTGVEESLSLALEHSESGVEEGCPVFTPCPGVTGLHAFASLACRQAQHAGEGPDAHFLRQRRLVLELCCALWGILPGETDSEPDSYSVHQARREALSRWLTAATRERALHEVQKCQQIGGDNVSGVWSYLSVGEISAASQLSQEMGDHRLALLLAQSAGSSQSRQLVAAQLQEWAQHKMDQFMEPDRLKVYTLLSGNALWQSSFGLVNCCEDLDWKRCLAVHLWFLSPPSAGITEALKLYTSAYSNDGGRPSYCVPPLPAYLEDSGEFPEEENAPCDTCYHLLQLYTDRTYPLHHALAPTSTTASHLDYRLSWQLLCVLQSVGYCHLSDQQVAAVCSSYAAQLDSLGLWHWAVFVLLHIPDPCRRENVIRELLGRRVTLSMDSDSLGREAFLLERLHIPPSWIHEAKWLRARKERRYSEEAWHLLKAGRMNDSHRVLLRHLAAEAIINERYKYLKQFLREMAPLEHSAGIQGWSAGGKVYLDYITMMDTLEEIKQGDLGAYELERLQPEVTSLCTRLGHLECRSPADRLCQSEMAKRTANLMRTLLMLQHRDRPIPTRLLAPHVGKLPLPEDYALQELRHLARGYMLELNA